MKLVFPGGEHPQVLLGLGVNRVGSDPGANVVIISVPGDYAALETHKALTAGKRHLPLRLS